MSENPDSVRGASRAIVVWWFRERPSDADGQARGLLKAMEAQCSLRVYAAPVLNIWRAWQFALRRRFPAAELPNPDILVGTGRDTHWSMLVARWARGGRIITLSKPNLPRWLFDLCIVPAHAGGVDKARMIATRGILPEPSAQRPKIAGTGLIMIGGPAPQLRWSDEVIFERVTEILARQPDYRWYVITTPQSSADMVRRIAELSAQNVFCMAHHEVDPKWLQSRIQDVEQIWVSEDNLAVIYQALTAGAAVGVLPVPRNKPSREIAALNGLVVFYPQWRDGESLHAPQSPFNESARCAAEIVKRWLQ